MKLRFGLALLMLSGVVAGCSHFRRPTGEKRFVLERSWARHTPQTTYMGTRTNQVMEPLLFSGLVIEGNEVDGLVAYDQNSGQQRWARAIAGGVTASAKIQDGVLYVGAGDGFFYALDAQTGLTKWSFPIRAEGIGAPLVEDGVVYFLTGTNSAYALKAQTGEQVWFYSRVDGAAITVRGASEPSSWGGRIYAGFSDGYLVALDKAKGTLVWERQLNESARFRDVDAKPVIDGDRIYISSYDGKLFALEAQTGSTIWVNDEGGFSAATIQGNTLYYSTSTRKVMALEKSSGKVLWSRDLKDTVASSPVLHRGLVFFGEWSGRFRAVDQVTGADVASFSTGRGVTSKAAVDREKDAFYIMTVDANLFAVRLRLKDKLTEF